MTEVLENAPVVHIARPLTIADIDLDLSDQAIQAYVKRHDNLVSFAKALWKEGRDYGPPFPGAKQNAVRKIAIDTLQQPLGLRPVYEILPESVIDKDTPYFKFVVRCKIFHGDYEVYQSVRSCSSLETKYKYRWVWENEFKTLPELKGLNRNGLPMRPKGQHTQYRVPNPEITDLENTILAMAQKRARVDAVLSWSGLSSDFCDEVVEAEVRSYNDPEAEREFAPPPPKKEPKGKGTKAQQQTHDPAKGRDHITTMITDNLGVKDDVVLRCVQELVADVVSDNSATFYDLNGDQTAEGYNLVKGKTFRTEVRLVEDLLMSVGVKADDLRPCRNIIAEMLTNGIISYSGLEPDDIAKALDLVKTDEFRERLRQEGIQFTEGK